MAESFDLKYMEELGFYYVSVGRRTIKINHKQ